MSPLPTLTQDEIMPWFLKYELINDCVLQVQKDLNSYGITLSYSGNPNDAYQELFLQLQPQIEKLLTSNSSLTEILYRVDVKESDVKKAQVSDEHFSASLTRLILWRELQKVVTRFLLKKNNLNAY